MGFGLAAVFSPPVGQYPDQPHPAVFVQGKDPVIEHVCGCNRRLGRVEFGTGHLGEGIDKGLLVDPANSFEGADIEGVLATQLPRMGGLDLTAGHIVLLLAFQGGNLLLGQDLPGLGHMFFQGGQPELEGLQAVPQPDTTHTAGGDGKPFLAEVVGDTHLSARRVFNGHFTYPVLDALLNPVFNVRDSPVFIQ